MSERLRNIRLASQKVNFEYADDRRAFSVKRSLSPSFRLLSAAFRLGLGKETRPNIFKGT